jgi:DNA-binding SARP family transcriptional activator
MLAAEHARPISHHELADELWRGEPPTAWVTSLKALVSRTRAALNACGMPGTTLIVGAPGIYRFILPPRGWVDVDVAKSSTHQAEARLQQGDLEEAANELFVAKLITHRGFLPGMTGEWVERRRGEFAELRLRALQCSARVNLATSSFMDAIRDARRAIDADPLRESSWWLLMDAHAANGDLASAIRAYEHCRSTLDDALGIVPSLATRERHAALLASNNGDSRADGQLERPTSKRESGKA